MKSIWVATILLLTAAFVPAQELVFFDGEVRVYERVGTQLFELQDSRDDLLTFGYVLDVNYVVRTFDGFAEILLPNGHMLKLDGETEVQLESVLSTGARSGDDVVSVTTGRLRSVVANLTGTGRGFSVRTPTAVGGVRGTDFVTQVTNNEEIIAVRSGLVNFQQTDGQSISLGANQFANALATTFTAVQSEDIGEQFYGQLEELSEALQEAQQEILAQLPAPPEEETANQPADESDAEDEGAEVQNAEPSVVTPADDSEDTPPTDNVVTGFMTGLTEILGLEIGSLTIDGTTYSKFIAQPTFTVGELRAGLYLPVVYSGNLFDPSEWYRPKGNNEWSFGTDQDWGDDPLVGLGDLVGDLALKIRFIEWGNQRDDFFFKIGNLNSLQLGHGLVMRGYANDTDFPAVRRVGFNVGFDFGGGGFEFITNDLTAPEIFGLRLYARPVPEIPFAIGISGVTDISPASDLPETDDEGNTIFAIERELDPAFVNLALDVEVPIVETDPLSVIAFGDIAGLLPILREDGFGLDAGPQWEALYEEESGLRNYGIATGVMGNVTLLDYRVEFQLFNGIFRPAFYDASYDRTRGDAVSATVAYLLFPNADEFQNTTLGVYGEAGFTIFDLVRIDAGYRWPWTADPDTGAIEIGDEDYLLASLTLQEGLLPLDISAALSYERTFFAPTIFQNEGFEGTSLFDEYTVLKGEIVYPIAPIMDIVGSVSTAVLRDSNGDIVYETRDGVLRPKFGPIITIETRLGGAGF